MPSRKTNPHEHHENNAIDVWCSKSYLPAGRQQRLLAACPGMMNGMKERRVSLSQDQEQRHF